MRITPLDVRKQEFRRGMRGYDADEVRAFLATLADEYEAVLVDNKQLRERIMEQDEKLSEYRNLERTLRDTLMTAERVTQDARETARKQGEMVMEEARQRVQQVLAEGRAGLDEMRREARAVHREKEAFLGRFRSLAEAQIQFVEAHRSDFADLDGRLLDHDRNAPAGAARPAAANAPTEPTPPVGADSQQRDQWRDYAIEQSARRAAAAKAAAEAEARAANDELSAVLDPFLPADELSRPVAPPADRPAPADPAIPAPPTVPQDRAAHDAAAPQTHGTSGDPLHAAARDGGVS